jgi:hypothetical protein
MADVTAIFGDQVTIVDRTFNKEDTELIGKLTEKLEKILELDGSDLSAEDIANALLDRLEEGSSYQVKITISFE